MRAEVKELLELGSFPGYPRADLPTLERQEKLLNMLMRPATDDEASALCAVFGPDDYYGLAWTLLHFIESAPGWPIAECLAGASNEWIATLRRRVENASRMATIMAKGAEHDEFLQLQAAGWTLRPSAARRPLPEELLGRYPWVPDYLRSLLSDYDQICRQDLKMWLLVSADYAGVTESAFRWNEWELQSLEAAGQNQAWRQEIIAFWDHHLPVALSVEDGYSYYALRSDGAVVAGREPEYEETMPAAKSYLEFLQRLQHGNLSRP